MKRVIFLFFILEVFLIGKLNFCSDKEADQIIHDTSNLLMASAKGDIPKVTELLAKPIDMNIKDGKGWTALMWAANKDKKEMCEFLISKGANMN